MKKLCLLISALIFMVSVEANEHEKGEDAFGEMSVCSPEKNGHRRCYRCYRYHPIRTNGYYYYYDNRYIPTWPGKIDFYFFDILRR